MVDCFYYDGKLYTAGTWIAIKSEKRTNFGNNVAFIYEGDNQITNAHIFHAWGTTNKYEIRRSELQDLIEVILYVPENQEEKRGKMPAKYINGIVEAWICYILGMFAICFCADVVVKVFAWIVVSIIFFSWRNSKMKGE